MLGLQLWEVEDDQMGTAFGTKSKLETPVLWLLKPHFPLPNARTTPQIVQALLEEWSDAELPQGPALAWKTG